MIISYHIYEKYIKARTTNVRILIFPNQPNRPTTRTQPNQALICPIEIHAIFHDFFCAPSSYIFPP